VILAAQPSDVLTIYLQLPRRGKQIDDDVDGGDHSDAHMHIRAGPEGVRRVRPHRAPKNRGPL
jgi:hypothetical protein